MVIKDRTYLWILIIFTIITICAAYVYISRKTIASQNWWKMTDFRNVPRETSTELIWCTINNAEQHKCENFAKATERDRISVGNDVFKIKCKQAFNKDECITLIDDGKATLTTLDAGEVFVGARYHSLVPIAQEVYEGGFKYYYSVAVIKRGTVTDINSLYDFRNRKVCFAGVETFAGWILPIYTLMKEGGMDIVDCNNHVKTAIKYFGPSCAVNCLTDKYNPIGDNSDKLCQLCVGKVPGGRCTDADPYADYDGAFRCLLEAGEIAFLKHNTVAQLTSGQEFVGVSKDGFELLCKDGSRRNVDDYLSCHWGSVPSDAVVTSSAVRFEDRKKYQKFLEKAANRYASVGNNFTALNDNKKTFDIKPEFDQYGNKINRFKRQNFGNFDQYKRYNDQPGQTGDQYNRNNLDQYNRNNDDPYNRNNQNNEFPKTHDPNNQFSRTNDPNSRTSNQFGQLNDPNRQSNQPDLYNQNFDQYGHNIDQSKQYEQDNNNNNNNQNSPNNPFYRDPYSINRDQFGINIDPYDRDPNTYNQGQDTSDVNYNPVNTNDGRNRSNITYFEVFNLFESTPLYGTHPNLIFQDATRNIAPVLENQQTYSGFLERSLDVIMGIRDCPVGRMSLCVTSDPEMEKCIKMKVAMKAQLLKPDMDCYKGHSQIHCMQAIRSGSADVAILDASDVYTAGFTYDLVPFISEVYNLVEPEYYVVAVAKESDPNTELTYLRGKYTCHGGINTAAGWVYPLAFLISNGWIRSYGCNSIRAAAEYFTKSCVPGALSTEYNTGVPYDNMCDLCHGASYRYCRRDASEDYYGHTGAFRCLVEGGGHVAFVKHTTVTENTGGKKREWWTRDNLNDDYELLCTDGTRKEINDYEKCNLGKVKANAIVTRGGYGYNTTQINAYTNLFLYAQTFYGKKTTDEFSFSMFSSAPPYSDLIFQDATTQLKLIDPDNRHFSAYLGSDFMRARRITDCHAGSSSVTFSLLTLILSAIFALVVVRS